MPSATWTMPALPTARCTTSWLRFIATAGVVARDDRAGLSSPKSPAPPVGCCVDATLWAGAGLHLHPDHDLAGEADRLAGHGTAGLGLQGGAGLDVGEQIDPGHHLQVDAGLGRNVREPGDLLLGLRVPKLGQGWGFHYEKFHRVAQAWATVGVAALVRGDDGRIAEARIGLTNMGTTPLRAAAVEAALAGAEGPEEVARAAEAAGADWVTFGPIYDTPSKRPFGAPQGLTALEQVALAVRVPVVAIGGITPARVADVRAAGAAGVAVISAILAAPAPADATRRFLEALA